MTLRTTLSNYQKEFEFQLLDWDERGEKKDYSGFVAKKERRKKKYSSSGDVESRDNLVTPHKRLSNDQSNNHPNTIIPSHPSLIID